MDKIDPSKVEWDAPEIDPAQVQWDDQPAAPAGNGLLYGLPPRGGAAAFASGDALNPLAPAGRQLGRVARSTVEGVAALPNMVGNAVGLDSSNRLSAFLTRLGLPTNDTPMERVTGAAMSGLAGFGTGSALGGAAGGAVGAALQSNPVQSALSSIFGPAAASIAAENGASPLEQMGAGLAGGMIPSAATAVGRTFTPKTASPSAATEEALLRQSKLDAARNIFPDEGLKVPTGYMPEGPSKAIKAVEGASGKILVQQAASLKNDKVFVRAAKYDLGIPNDAPLSLEKVNGVITDAAKVTDDVISAFGPNTKLKPYHVQEFGKLGGGAYNAALEAAPGVIKDTGIFQSAKELSKPLSAEASIGLIRSLREDASGNFALATSPNADKGRSYYNQLARSQKGMADILENMVERNLSDIGRGDLMKEFRAARQLQAQAFTVKSVLNDAGNNVNMQKLAAMANEGAPISGKLKTAATFAGMFNKAAQMPEKMGGIYPLSPLDLWAGGSVSGFGVASGNPAAVAIGAGIPVARWGARAAMLSDPVQNNLVSFPRYSPYAQDLGVSPAVIPGIETELAKRRPYP
jgi:hypothetical protein